MKKERFSNENEREFWVGLTGTEEENRGRYWASAVHLSDEACQVELPAGTVIARFTPPRFAELKTPITVDVEKRGATDYDNQRRASYQSETFYIVGKSGMVPSDSDLEGFKDLEEDLERLLKEIPDEK